MKTLSGGERNRLLLARLFAQPANLLVLDEPTNDLDIESLELLEDTLQSYPGTLLLVSHDRAFLDSVVTQTLVAGRTRGVEGVRRRLRRLGRAAAARGSRARRLDRASGLAGAARSHAPGAARAAGLTFKEQRELERLPAEIEALERDQHALTERMSAPDLRQARGGRHQGRPRARCGNRASTGCEVRALGRARYARRGRKGLTRGLTPGTKAGRSAYRRVISPRAALSTRARVASPRLSVRRSTSRRRRPSPWRHPCARRLEEIP